MLEYQRGLQENSTPARVGKPEKQESQRLLLQWITTKLRFANSSLPRPLGKDWACGAGEIVGEHHCPKLSVQPTAFCVISQPPIIIGVTIASQL
jgi:hypothetical protein